MSKHKLDQFQGLGEEKLFFKLWHLETPAGGGVKSFTTCWGQGRDRGHQLRDLPAEASG